MMQQCDHSMTLRPRQAPKTPYNASYPATLPFEIIRALFLCLFREAPLTAGHVVAQVCQSWRLIAIETGLLWSRIAFDGSMLRFNQQICWIKRSKDTLLDIDIAARLFHHPPSCGTKLRAILDIITPEATRWYTFKVTGRLTSQAFVTLCEHLESVVPINLVSFTTSQLAPFEIAPMTLRPFAGDTPKLRDLTLKQVPWSLGSPIFNNLRHLVLDDHGSGTVLNAEAIYNLLRRSPELEEFMLTSSKDWIVPKTRPAPLTHPRLSRERLQKMLISSQGIVDILLQSIYLPSLLTLVKRYVLQPYMFPILLAFNTLTSLQDVTIFGSARSTIGQDANFLIQLPQVLSGLTSLVDIQFWEVDFQGQIVDQLAELCPRVVCLTMKACEGFDGRALREACEKKHTLGKSRRMQAVWIVDCARLKFALEDQEWLYANVDRVQWQ